MFAITMGFLAFPPGSEPDALRRLMFSERDTHSRFVKELFRRSMSM